MYMYSLYMLLTLSLTWLVGWLCLFVWPQKYPFAAEDLEDKGHLGEGAFGTVSKMMFTKTNTMMAVKVSLSLSLSLSLLLLSHHSPPPLSHTHTLPSYCLLPQYKLIIMTQYTTIVHSLDCVHNNTSIQSCMYMYTYLGVHVYST